MRLPLCADVGNGDRVRGGGATGIPPPDRDRGDQGADELRDDERRTEAGAWPSSRVLAVFSYCTAGGADRIGR
jgi:hypothetical protein